MSSRHPAKWTRASRPRPRACASSSPLSSPSPTRIQCASGLLRAIQRRGGDEVPVALLGDVPADRQRERRRRRHREAARKAMDAGRGANRLRSMPFGTTRTFAGAHGNRRATARRRRDDGRRHRREGAVDEAVAVGDADVPERGARGQPSRRRRRTPSRASRWRGSAPRRSSVPAGRARATVLRLPGPGRRSGGSAITWTGRSRSRPRDGHLTVFGNHQHRRPAIAVEAPQQVHQAQLAAAHDGAVIRHDEDRCRARRSAHPRSFTTRIRSRSAGAASKSRRISSPGGGGPQRSGIRPGRSKRKLAAVEHDEPGAGVPRGRQQIVGSDPR